MTYINPFLATNVSEGKHGNFRRDLFTEAASLGYGFNPKLNPNNLNILWQLNSLSKSEC